MEGGFRPDVILLDLMMPVLNGFDVLRVMHRTPRWSSIPVVIVSANQGNDLVDLGTAAIIRKQCAVCAFVAALRRHRRGAAQYRLCPPAHRPAGHTVRHGDECRRSALVVMDEMQAGRSVFLSLQRSIPPLPASDLTNTILFRAHGRAPRCLRRVRAPAQGISASGSWLASLSRASTPKITVSDVLKLLCQRCPGTAPSGTAQDIAYTFVLVHALTAGPRSAALPSVGH